MFRFHIITCATALIWLSGCTATTHQKDSIDWEDIDFAKIVCDDRKTAPSGCKAPDSHIISGSGHHGGHK